MRVLFVHPNPSGQFGKIATYLAASNHVVVFVTAGSQTSLPGVQSLLYTPARLAASETHFYLRPVESAVLHGQGAYRAIAQLKQQGFVPDVVYGISGWGSTLFIKDVLPSTPFLCYFEWFYSAHGSDADYDPSETLTPDDEARVRIRNAPILIDLYSCDRGICPTVWQHRQFPEEFKKKIRIVPDGVDTEYFRPRPSLTFSLPRLNLDLSNARQIVTYVARGMEPYRGFPQFMEAVALIQQKCPDAHFVIAGEDRVFYGRCLPENESYKNRMLKRLDLDPSRIHFTGWLNRDEYLQLLQASAVHVYLTRPFVLSWSMLEAMSTGCVVIGSATPPVMEVIQDHSNGLLVDFFSPRKIAAKIEDVLKQRIDASRLRLNARRTIVGNFSLRPALRKQEKMLSELIKAGKM